VPAVGYWGEMRRTALGATALALFLLALGAPAPPAATPSALPSCADGPVRTVNQIIGTACDDTIVVPAAVATVLAGPGDDTIRAAPLADSATCPSECRLGVGSQTFDGGPGNDVVFGERGNDILNGGEGDDRLFGGIGDDLLRGGPGSDRLAGGFGADSIDGEAGDDRVRGDGTIDRIFDTGGGVDTLSYATGVTPGFGGTVATAGFPAAGGERGLRLDLGAGGQNANNGIAALGGGVDEVEGGSFEIVIGTPFSDYIVGTAAAQTVYGGGGADVLIGGGGADSLNGGADVDSVDSGDGSVTTRDGSKASVGLMNPADPVAAQIYLVGGSGGESIVATYASSPAPRVEFTIAGGGFDAGAVAQSGCTLGSGTATCPLADAPDSVLIAGMGGEDEIDATGFPTTTSVVVLGGNGGDELSGGEASEEVLVDGPDGGADRLEALGQDDALLHNGGADQLLGGNGNDLFLSVSTCDGQTLDGGPGRDNGSWARLMDEGVTARLDEGRAGGVGAGTTPACPGGVFDGLIGIEDLEGSEAGDVFVGDGGRNQLLGHKGPDFYAALAGDDSILANSGDDDLAIDCGEGNDTALIDFRPQFNDPVPVGCEIVREAAPNNFRTVTELPPPPPPPDTTAPRTRIDHRPRALLRVRSLPRRVAFRFSSSELGSSFRCKLDRKPVRLCTAPRVYKVGRGRHAFRVFAIDAAGNRDRSPALFRFEVERVRARSGAG
jgi:Ca2+-binding RTX toxin-like protein